MSQATREIFAGTARERKTQEKDSQIGGKISDVLDADSKEARYRKKFPRSSAGTTRLKTLI